MDAATTTITHWLLGIVMRGSTSAMFPIVNPQARDWWRKLVIRH